jgi:lipopolysaccharide export system protein LptA
LCAGLGAVLAPLVAARAQAPAKPVTQDELLRQIESLNPPSADPAKRTPGFSTPDPARAEARGTLPPPARPVFAEQRGEKPVVNAAATPTAGAGANGADTDEKKTKGPTVIVALEATFDQKAHVAVFIHEVVVTDPEFNVVCDKLTAYLKHDDKPAGEAPATPRPKATPAPSAAGATADKPKSGGLDKALAEADPGKICTVTQDKKEADGTITHSIGHGKKVHYDANTGDITLYGHPDTQQGVNTCVSTDENTIMTLNRDGHMRVNGPHKTVIVDQSQLNPNPTPAPK